MPGIGEAENYIACFSPEGIQQARMMPNFSWSSSVKVAKLR
jgi:hypothetical protein